jgi:hypothetical protein
MGHYVRDNCCVLSNIASIIILLLYAWFEHPRHTYRSFGSTFSDRGVTQDPLQPVEVLSPPGMRCMVPQPYAAVGNRLYPGVLGHNWWPTVLEVIYPDIDIFTFRRHRSSRWLSWMWGFALIPIKSCLKGWLNRQNLKFTPFKSN